MGKKQKKVAYVVFSGFAPGVYLKWTETEKQTKGFSGCSFRGYTTADGGKEQALIDYEKHLAKFETAEKNHDAVHGVAPSHLSPSTTHTDKRTRALQPVDCGPVVKRQKSKSTFQPEQHVTKSGQRIQQLCSCDDESREAVFPDDAEIVLSLLSSDEEGEPTTPHASERSFKPSNIVDLCESDSEDEFDCISLDMAFSQTISNMNPDSEPKLCEEQAALVETIINGQNVFYTGSAGCGKSTVLKRFVRCLKELDKTVEVIAPTGRAALNVSGRTLFNYAGWTPSTVRKPMDQVLRACHQRQTWKRLHDTNVLVIDEISMIENFCLERLNRIMKEARGNDAPFGGVQLIVSGDFCQLPPVRAMEHCLECGAQLEPIAGDRRRCSEHVDFMLSDQWAFMSKAWNECNFVHVNLTTIHRQKDSTFVKLLEKLRIGKLLSYKERDLLANHESRTDGAVKLFPLKEAVKQTNDREFNRLQTPITTYHCHDDFRQHPEHDNLGYLTERNHDGTLVALNQHQFEGTVKLREGMRVILLINLAPGLINGSQGVITGFQPAKIRKEPFKTAGEYADKKRALLQEFVRLNNNVLWPMVRFSNGEQQPIYPHCMINEYGRKQPWSLLSRTQVPLMAAWAMTIHKAQGMTLDKVIVDLARTFEKGHAYVALSRASSLEGLKVETLGDLNRGTDQRVKAFLEQKFGAF